MRGHACEQGSGTATGVASPHGAHHYGTVTAAHRTHRVVVHEHHRRGAVQSATGAGAAVAHQRWRAATGATAAAGRQHAAAGRLHATRSTGDGHTRGQGAQTTATVVRSTTLCFCRIATHIVTKFAACVRGHPLAQPCHALPGAIGRIQCSAAPGVSSRGRCGARLCGTCQTQTVAGMRAGHTRACLVAAPAAQPLHATTPCHTKCHTHKHRYSRCTGATARGNESRKQHKSGDAH